MSLTLAKQLELDKQRREALRQREADYEERKR